MNVITDYLTPGNLRADSMLSKNGGKFVNSFFDLYLYYFSPWPEKFSVLHKLDLKNIAHGQ
ncbi:MAG TPA: hypothetical protein DEO65_18355 [Bacillus bacterium]|uniref:Uncharacterized protein n=1 Tax=Siminovitchia fordii TaxID=254759 RepID=A0ABQ4K9U6_9BACI|nr:hypothetical protein J1TS3_30520 [Siminovitchia fordii]HBZ11800.1 hypothetical protein [Bacillus sp. (in: firmicutes)]